MYRRFLLRSGCVAALGFSIAFTSAEVGATDGCGMACDQFNTTECFSTMLSCIENLGYCDQHEQTVFEGNPDCDRACDLTGATCSEEGCGMLIQLECKYGPSGDNR